MDEIPKEKHDHGPLKFPEHFLWGAATSAHQVEGNNTESDWWEWEKNKPEDKRSGNASDEYNRFEEDFKLAKSLNLNAQRISVEWARIEPGPGQFDESVIEHYKRVLKSLKSKHFKVMLTLWHFTLPKWVADEGGWENAQTTENFLVFIERIVPEFNDYVDFWITLNEPGVYAFMSYLQGEWPPRKKSRWSALRVQWNLIQAHKRAYYAVKMHSHRPVGIAQNMQSFHSSHKHSFIEQMSVLVSDLVTNHSFYKMTGYDTHDFLGVNYYFHHRFNRKNKFFPTFEDAKQQHQDISDLGWEVFPQGLFNVLMDISNHKPVFITECGIASTNDDRRTRFLIQYLSEVYRAIESGVRVKGFFYWSLVDNFEWDKGFDPRFGLIEVDYKNQERTIRPSAYVYSEIAKHNKIPHSLLRLLGHTVRVEEVLCYMHDGPKILCEHFKE